ncbi:MAG: TIGR01459 family HAD-type hydrolase [Holosporales bacterium]|nr:TIGR01459 family HAD-type hydrolase [Holosporales bacterium]
MDHISDILDKYDGYFLDVWGVLYHEGVGVIPSAREGLRLLQEHQKKVLLVSNASRPGKDLAAFLDGKGISRASYQHIVTSGDCTHAYFRQYTKPVRCFASGYFRNQAIFEGVPVTLVSSPEEAEIFVPCVPEQDAPTLDPFLPLLDRCLAAKLPMICANCDEYVLVKGERVVRTGLFARYYEEKGGKVAAFGKPHACIYEYAHTFVPDIPKSRLCMVGDGLKTDILGANNFGIDSLWISSGVSAGDKDTGITPTYQMPVFG